MDAQAIRLTGVTRIDGRRLTLAEDLDISSIPILAITDVRAHKRHMIDQHRVGIYKLLGPIFYQISGLLNFIGRDNSRLQWTFVVAVLLPLFSLLAWVTEPSYSLTSTIGEYICLCSSGAVVALCLYFVAKEITFFSLPGTAFFRAQAAMTTWDRWRLLSFDEKTLNAFKVPSHLRERIRHAGRVEDTQIFVEAFQADPFIVVTRRSGWRFEQVYIGAWGTGVLSLDDA